MAAKFPTTNRDVNEPFTRRTANPVDIDGESFTIYFRRTVSGESGVWVGVTGTLESKGARTLDTAAEAAVEARKVHNALVSAGERLKNGTDAEKAPEATPEDGGDVPAPVKVKGKNKGKGKGKGKADAPAPVIETLPEDGSDVPATAPAESVSLSGVLSDVPLSAPAPVKGKGKGKGKSKTAQAVADGAAVKAPASVAPLKVTGGAFASLVHSAWGSSSNATTQFTAREITASDAFTIISKARKGIESDAARALADGVNAEHVDRLTRYADALTLHHLALIGRGGERLTPAANKRNRQKLNKLYASMTAA